MKTAVQFRNFEGFEHNRIFVEELVSHTLGKFEAWRQFDTHIIISMAKNRSLTHNPIFECELLLNARNNQRPIVVKKQNIDFHQATRACMRAAEKILRRNSKVRVSRRRHVEIPYAEPDSATA